MPLFHSNSTGNLGNSANVQQFQQATEFSNYNMGGGGTISPLHSPSFTSLTSSSDVNVAYDGTFGDLSAAGNARLFNAMTNDLDDFGALLGAADGEPATDFTAINSGCATGATVSPKDVFSYDSVPPSTSFTNLTTPGSLYLNTPADDYETSPLFTDNLGIDSQASAENWYSLFPDDTLTPAAPAMTRTVSTSSASAQIMVHPGGEPMARKRSSTTTSPTFSPVVKHSAVAGVNPRKRDKPLPPILVDENDTVALKRARNTAAARKSRAKKVAERDDLEGEIADLKAQVEFWKSRALGRTTSSDDSED